MRTAEELERVAFREALTAEEDDLLADLFLARASQESSPRARAGMLKQGAFFAVRAFDKGARDPASLVKYTKLLADAQRASPSDSFRRKLAQMKSAMAGKDAHGAVLKKLARLGSAGNRGALATDAEVDAIEESLNRALPPSYRAYLKQYAHRQIGTYEPFTASELLDAARDAWDDELESYLLPFLEDNADHFCFDLRVKDPEPPVVFRPHHGTSKEIWPNFAAWVEECWLAELDD